MDTTDKNHIKAHIVSKFLFVLSFAYFILTRIRFLDIPLDRDEGSYLYMGKMFFRGYIPYVDFYEIKPPGMFFIYGLYDLIFGYNNIILHLGLVVIQLSMAFLVYKITSLITKDENKALVGSSILMLCLLIFNLLGFAIMSEYFFIISILLSILFLLKTNENNFLKTLFWSGLFFGLSAMIRQHAIFFTVPILFLLSSQIKTFQLQYKKSFISFCFGGMAIVLPLLFYVLLRGSFDEMTYWVIIRPNQSYIDAVSLENGLGYLTGFVKAVFNNSIPLMILFICGLVFQVFQLIKIKESRVNGLFLILFLFSSFAAVIPGLRFYGHYWIMFVPIFSIIASYSYIYIQKIPTYIIPVLLTIAISIQINETYEINLNTNPKLIYQFVYGENPNSTLPKIVDFLKRRLKKQDEIYVFGSEPQVYYECGKVLKSPHVYVGFLHIPGETSNKYQQELIQHIDKTKPKYILHLQNVNSINMKEGGSQHLYQWIFSHESRFYHPIAYADIDISNTPSYYFERDAVGYQPKSDNYIILYEINDGIK